MITDRKDKEVALDKARKNAEAWQMKLSVDDCTIALGQAEELEKRPLAWLSSNYWKLKKLMAVHYNLKHHRVERTWVMALKELKREHEAQEALEALERMAEFRFGQSNLTSFVAQLDELRGIAKAAEPEVKQFLGYLSSSSSGSSEIQEMLKSAEEFVVLNRELKTLLLDYFDYPWLRIREIVLEIQTELPLIRELGSVLGELKKAPPRLAASFRHLPLAVEELEGALAANLSMASTGRIGI